MTQQRTNFSKTQKAMNIFQVLRAFFSQDETPDYEYIPGRAGKMSSGRQAGHQSRRMEKSRRRMRKASQRRNRC